MKYFFLPDGVKLSGSSTIISWETCYMLKKTRDFKTYRSRMEEIQCMTRSEGEGLIGGK